MTATASGASSAAAVLKPAKPSIATTVSASLHAFGRAESHVLNACFERPGTISSRRAGPVFSRIGVRSMMTSRSCRRAWCDARHAR